MYITKNYFHHFLARSEAIIQQSVISNTNTHQEIVFARLSLDFLLLALSLYGLDWVKAGIQSWSAMWKLFPLFGGRLSTFSSPHILSFDQCFIRRAGLQWGSTQRRNDTNQQIHSGQRNTSRLLKSSTRFRWDPRPAQLPGWMKAFSKPTKQELWHTEESHSCLFLWRACKVSKLRTAWAVLRCFTLGMTGAGGGVCLFSCWGQHIRCRLKVLWCHLSKMCEIFLVFVVLQCEDTWQMLLCSLMQAFLFSLCFFFIIALVFAEWTGKGACG